MKIFILIVLLALPTLSFAYFSNVCYTQTIEDVCVLKCIINGNGISLLKIGDGTCSANKQVIFDAENN